MLNDFYLTGDATKDTELILSLGALLNKHGIDNLLNTPDYILAEGVRDFLRTTARLTATRDRHSGFIPKNTPWPTESKESYEHKDDALRYYQGGRGGGKTAAAYESVGNYNGVELFRRRGDGGEKVVETHQGKKTVFARGSTMSTAIEDEMARQDKLIGEQEPGENAHEQKQHPDATR